MVRKPTILKTNKNSVDVLNAIRNLMGDDFKAIVPVALAQGAIKNDGTPATITDSLLSLRNFGEAVTSDRAIQNRFISALVNKVGLTLIRSKIFSNPLKIFKQGVLEYGEIVEEIFINLIEAQDFNPEKAETELLKRELPDVRATFHLINLQKFYKVTTHDKEIKKAFLSLEGVNDFLNKIIESVVKSYEYDEYLVTKYLIANQILKGNVHVENVDVDNSTEIIKKLKRIKNDFTFINEDYNTAKVSTNSNIDNIYVLTTSKFNADSSVDVLAKAFNLTEVEYREKEIVINSFGFTQKEIERITNLFSGTVNAFNFTSEQLELLEKVPLVLLDKDFILIYDNDYLIDSVYNQQGLYYNHFLHTTKTYSVSPFNNCCVFAEVESNLTKLIITPENPTLQKGQALAFMVDATKTGFASGAVTFKVEGSTENKSYIDKNGVLYVGLDEKAESLTVKATSKFKESVTVSTTVTLR